MSSQYEIRIQGKAESRISKSRLKDMMFAIEDYMRIQKANTSNRDNSDGTTKERNPLPK